MAYIKQGNYMLLCGKVTKDAVLRTTATGKHVVNLSVKYGQHHDVDGNSVGDYMNISAWGDTALFVGNEDTGVAKGDMVLAIGQLVRDDYRSQKSGEEEFKMNAEIILDATSIFQIAEMVISGEVGSAGADEQSAFDDSEEKTPFEKEVEDSDAELPY